MQNKKQTSAIEDEEEQIDDVVLKLVRAQKYQEIVDLAKSQNRSNDYSNFKLQGIKYSLGDDVQFSKESQKNRISWGKILEVSGIDTHGKMLPLIRLQKYIDREGLRASKHKAILKDGLGEFELFLTQEEDWIFAGEIQNKIQVLVMDDYEKVNSQDNQIFYSRSQYDTKTDAFIPTIDKWQRICHCNAIYNPDKFYVCCEQCDQWLHGDCENVQAKDIKKEQDWYCKKCKSEMPKQANKKKNHK